VLLVYNLSVLEFEVRKGPQLTLGMTFA